MQQGNENKHQRRERYSGTHPKLSRKSTRNIISLHIPELRDIESQRQNAGWHSYSCSVEEVMECLNPNPAKSLLIARSVTAAMLGIPQAHWSDGKMIAMDVDGAELERTRLRLSKDKRQLVFTTAISPVSPSA